MLVAELFDRYSNTIVPYRNAMYNGKLISHKSVRYRKLSTLPLVAEKAKTRCDTTKSDEGPLENVTLMLVDTTCYDMHETVNEAGSRSNDGEANIVVFIC